MEYRFLLPQELPAQSRALFDILAGNMTQIAPTDNSLDEDYAIWSTSIVSLMQEEGRAIILAEQDGALAGYFQYQARNGVLMMEEAEIAPQYQGAGILRGFYAFLLPHLGDLSEVEAYANRSNERSIAILRKMGLSPIGTNASGSSFHFRGRFADLLRWIETK